MPASEWAGRYQQPQGAETETAAAPAEQLAAWLALERVVFGRALPHWVLCLLAVCVLGAGPSSLGYIVLGLALYKVYTLHQAGHTAAGLWAEFSANTAKKTTGSGKKKKQQTQRAGR